MPFQSESFDWAYCQHGLQFFPDQPAALAEIRRVLVDDGTLVVAVWQGLERHSYFHAINEIAYQNTGVHIIHGPFSLGNNAQLSGMMEGAGFRDVRIEQVSITTRTDQPETALRMQIEGAIIAIPQLQHLGGAKRSELADDLTGRARHILECHTFDGELSIQWHANVVIARG